MPIYQNATVDADKLILGNNKVEVAASVAGTFVNLGAGKVNTWKHSPILYDSQAGNAPDPVEGVADETCEAAWEMIEYDASVMNTMWGGLINVSTASSVQTIHAGGNADTTIAKRAFRFTNTRTVSGATIRTILTVYSATMDAGPSFTFKSDNDADPVMVMDCALTGKNDGLLAAGQQLYKITHDVAAS
jgi:hypothetical protein